MTIDGTKLEVDGWRVVRGHELETRDGGAVFASVLYGHGGAIVIVEILRTPDERTARRLLDSCTEQWEPYERQLPPGTLGDEAYGGPHAVAFRIGATAVTVRHVHGDGPDVLALAQRVMEQL